MSQRCARLRSARAVAERRGKKLGGGGSFLSLAHVRSIESWQTETYLLCGAVGCSLYFAWLFISLAIPSFIDSSVLVSESATYRAGFALGFSFMLIVGFVGSDAISSVGGRLALSAAALVACPVASLQGLVDGVSPYADVIAWAVSGFGGGALLLLASPFLSSLNHKPLTLLVSLSFASSALVSAVFLSFPVLLSAWAWGALVVLCVVMLTFAGSIVAENVAFVSVAESKGRNQGSPKSNIAVLGNSVCIGFTVFCVSLVVTAHWRFALICLVAAAAGCLMAYDSARSERINEGVQLKFFLPCAALGFLPIPFFGETGILIGCVVLTFVFSMQFITNVCALSESVHLFKLAPIRSFASGRLVNVAGTTCGYFVGFLTFSVFGSIGGFSSIVVLFILLALLIIMATLFYQDRYPSVQDGNDDAGQGASDERKTGSADGCDSAAEGGDGVLSDGRRKGEWMRKCDAFAENYELTPRETELLRLLAKGHDMEFIQAKLYISKSTIKTHTYNIYGKAGVHSRKDLMTAIRNTPLERNDGSRKPSV